MSPRGGYLERMSLRNGADTVLASLGDGTNNGYTSVCAPKRINPVLVRPPPPHPPGPP